MLYYETTKYIRYIRLFIRPAAALTTEPGPIAQHRNINLLPSTDCGPISTNHTAGEEKARLGEFPWMALLRYQTRGAERQIIFQKTKIN